MKTLDKLRSNFFNKKSFNVGFNNRSPLSYISSTGPSVPSFSDPGIKSFSPSDWEGAYDTSDAVRAETKAEIAKGEGVAGAVWGGVKKIAGDDSKLGEAMGDAEKLVGADEESKKSQNMQKFLRENPTATRDVIDKYEDELNGF
jgi:hypothetical protein